MAAASGTALLMQDTRAPVPQPTEALSYVHMAFYVNARYALRHGYSLLFLQLRAAAGTDGAGCVHPLFGARHPSYCKLAALGEALVRRRFAAVLWLDSDAIMQHHALSLPAMLRKYRAPASYSTPADGGGGGGGAVTSGGTAVAEPSVYAAWDTPFSYGPNCGVMLWRNTPEALRALQTWWQMDGRPFGARHDYEQHAMQWRLVHLWALHGVIETLPLQTMETNTQRSREQRGGGGGGGGGDGGGGGGDRKAKAKAKAKARAKAKAKAAGAGGQSDAGGGGIADPQLAAMAAQLEERKRQLAAAEAEVARQVEVARKQAESVAHARTELAQAEREKKEQGSKVDAAAVGANEELRREAARRGDVLSAAEAHKERGDRALRAGDLGAARGFYGEAVELAEEGRLAEYHFARLRANRCACLLRMGLPAEALADAEAAARLDPNWAKAAYRLGCVQHALGRRAAAAEALRRAVALATEAEAAEIEARLATVQRELDAEAAEAAARKAEAAKLAAAGDWEAARAAYSALLEAAWQEDTDPDPALLANRAACALRLGQLEACVADCDAALGDGDEEDDEGDGEGDAGGEARLPARLRWKLLLRRAEALRGLGRPDEAARSLDQAVALPHDADAAAVLARVRDSLHACAV